jgi:hypothetical protein
VARRLRREGSGFNLAFLDVMSCGLGAVILIFLLMKHNADRFTPTVETLETDLATATQQSAALDEELQHLVAIQEDGRKKAGHLRAAVNAAEIELDQLKAENQNQQGIGKKLQNAATTLTQKQASAPIPIAGKAVEQYIIGMSVEGRRIAILLDTSSSMTDENLIDIVRRKLQADAAKKAGPKWQRAIKATRWLVSKVPATSEYAVIGFQASASSVSKSSTWLKAADTSAAGKVSATLSGIVPTGGTNFEAAVDRALALRPKPSSIYIVTDGLPTMGVGRAPMLKGCGKNKVSEECRIALFGRAAAKLTEARVPVNVILLPMEGDPTAADAYWRLSLYTGGVMLAPPGSWP